MTCGRRLTSTAWGGQEWGWSPEAGPGSQWKLTASRDEENQVLKGKEAQRRENGW